MSSNGIGENRKGLCQVNAAGGVELPIKAFPHNKLHPAGSTKYREEASNHGYLVLRTMLMHVRGYPTIFYALDYLNVSTFLRQSRYGAKNLFFSAV